MYRLIEIAVGTIYSFALLSLTLLAIKLSNIFNSDWFLLLIPIFFAGSVYIFTYLEEYTHYMALAIFRYRQRKSSTANGRKGEP